MRAQIAMAATATLIASLTPGFAATKLSPDEIKATFFNGQPFKAATLSGVEFKMTFTTDGKVTRQPSSKTGGSKGEGTWEMSKDGFCTTWKNAKMSCFTIVNSGPNKWSVMRGPSAVAVWSK